MGNKKKVFVALWASAMLALAAGLAAPLLGAENRVAATEGQRSIAISVDGMTPVSPLYEIPVGSEQGFSVLSMVDGQPAGLLRTGAVEWSLAADGNAQLEANPDEFVATVRADAPGEAGLYAAAGDGFADMISLVFTEMKPAAPPKSERLSEAAIVQPRSGAVFHVPPVGTAPLLITAETNAPADTHAVHFAWPDRLTPVGISRDTSGPPFTALIPDITGVASADIEAVSKDTSISANASASWTLSTAADSNNNGFPDHPFALELSPGDAWVASPAGSSGPYVVMAGLPSARAADEIQISASNSFAVLIPGTAGLYEIRVPHNLIQPHETGILVMAEAPELSALLGETLAADVPPFPEDADAILSSYLLVDVLVSEDAATWKPLQPERLAAHPLKLAGHDISGLAAGINARLYGFDAAVIDSADQAGPHIAFPPDAAWTPATNGVALHTDGFTAEVSNAAILGLFSTSGLLKITDINNVAIGGAQDYAIGGGVIEIGCENLPRLPASNLHVTIDGQAAAVSTVHNGVITVTVPRAADLAAPAPSAAVDIRLEIAGTGEFDAIPSGFTYLGPSARYVTPEQGSAAGNTHIVIEGNGFDPNGMAVLLDGAPVRVGPVTPVALAGVTSAGEPGRARLELLTANNFTGVLDNAFTYTADAALTDSMTALSDDGLAGSSTDSSSSRASDWNDAYAERRADGTQQLHRVAASTGLTLSSIADHKTAGMSIRDIIPAAGPVAGGNAVLITGTNFPPVFDESANAGNVVRIGRVATNGEASVDVPIHLLRKADAPAAPSVINFFLSFNSGVLAYNGYTANPAVAGQYGKHIQLNAGEDTIGIILYGGTEELTLEGQANPFELLTLNFEVRGDEGESCVLPVRDLTMATATAVAIADTAGEAGIVTVGNSVAFPDPPRVFFGENQATLVSRNESMLEVIAPAGAAPAAVDVGIDASYPGNSADTAVSRASEGAGYTYIPEGGLQIENVTVAGTEGVMSLDGGTIVISGQGFSTVLSLTLVFSDGTTVALAAGIDFVVNNDGQITLTITPQRLAELLKKSVGKGLLPPGPVKLILETAAGSVTLENAFVVAPESAEIALHAILPESAWVIGGIVAEILGQNFGAPNVMTAAFEYTTPESNNGDGKKTLQIPLEILSGPDYPNSSTRLYVRIPPLPGVNDLWPASLAMARLVVRRTDALTEASLEASEGTPPFTYYRWHDDGEAVTTAFYYDNAQGVINREIVLNSGPLNAALTVPPLNTAFFDSSASKNAQIVYVMARAAVDETAFGAVDFSEAPGKAIANAWVFDIHLYADASDSKALLPPAGELLYREIFPEFQVPAGTDGTAVLPARMTIPVDFTTLTADRVRGGRIALYSQPTALDHLSAPGVSAAVGAPPDAIYQSTILESFDGVPEFFSNTENAQALETIRARIYSFGALTLRRGINAVPDPVLTAVSAPDGGSAEGPLQGGDEIVIYGSGLGWLESVEFGEADGKAFTPAVIIGGGDGTNEFALRVLSPEGTSPGAVDIRVTTATGKQAVIEKAFTYTARENQREGFFGGIATLLLGLFAALIGLFAGGAPGSGGPCFIATAAYDTPFEAGLDTLRSVRDVYLLDNALGTAFVDAYYRVSPQAAAAVARYPVLAAAVRLALTPVIAVCKLALAMPHATAAVGLLAMAGTILRKMRFRFRRV